jgi:hypothetical protein
MLVPWPSLSFSLYILSAIAVLGMTVACWKRPGVPLALRYASLLLATVLVAPHLTVYDLVILAPAFLLLADWLLGQPRSSAIGWLGILLYLIYMLPLLGPFARLTHVQLSVLAMMVCSYMAYRLGRQTA